MHIFKRATTPNPEVGLASMAWVMGSRVLGPDAGPLDGPSPCPLTERETCMGIVRGCPDKGPPACPGPGAGPVSGRGNPEGFTGMTVKRFDLVTSGEYKLSNRSECKVFPKACK